MPTPIPVAMREALDAMPLDFVIECETAYEAADDETRADIAAFFESDGPARVREIEAGP